MFPQSFNLSQLNGSNGFVIQGIDAGDYSGSSVSNAGDINGDGIDDLVIGAPRAGSVIRVPFPFGRFTYENVIRGETYVVFGGENVASSGKLQLAELDGNNGFVINGIDRDDDSGDSVSNAGDINGDGVDDLIIGAKRADPNEELTAGESYVVFGGKNFGASVELFALNGRNGFVLNGIDGGEPSSIGDFSGTSVSNAGDINGDGIDDLIIGAIGGDGDANATLNSGESYVVFGGKNVSSNGSFELSDLDGQNGFVINGIDLGDGSGNSVSNGGDINGDGLDDLIIAATFADPNGEVSGETYVVFGSQNLGSSGSLELSALDGQNGFVINGIDEADRSGNVVSNAGDVNGDGFDDLIIGARRTESNSNDIPGESYVVFGGNNVGRTGSLELSSLNGQNGFVLKAIDSDDYSGSSVSNAGDINGDGIDDLIIGALSADPNGNENAGESYVVFGERNLGSDGSFELAELDGVNGFILNGVSPDNLSGDSVSNAGDINNDGIDDLIIGARRASPNGQLRAGESYVVFGQQVFSTTEDSPLVKNVFLTDNQSLAITSVNGSNANVGTQIVLDSGALLKLNSNGTFTYDPNGQFDQLDPQETASDSFTYTSSNGQTRTTGITIQGVDQPTIQILNGNAANNFLFGTVEPDLIRGLAGNDDLVGFNNDDILDGGTGNDFVFGSNGHDSLVGSRGNDTLWGQADDDFLDGGQGADSLLGNNGNDTVLGADGNDTIQGNLGDDYLVGNNGRDRIQGQAGHDTMIGGNGDDTLRGQAGNDYLLGNSGNDSLIGDNGLDTLDGGAGNDILFGVAGNDNLVGGDGNDTLWGQADHDYLDGGAGNDRVLGNHGNDTLVGGTGNDTLFGNLGADKFVLNPDSGIDLVKDYSKGIDKFILSGGLEFADLTLTNLGSNIAIKLGSDSSQTLAIVENVIALDASDFILH